MVAPFDEFYKKDWETYKWSMPTSRFFGYWSYMQKVFSKQNQSPEDVKRELVESVDWKDEVRELKKHGNNRRKT